MQHEIEIDLEGIDNTFVVKATITRHEDRDPDTELVGVFELNEEGTMTDLTPRGFQALYGIEAFEQLLVQTRHKIEAVDLAAEAAAEVGL